MDRHIFAREIVAALASYGLDANVGSPMWSDVYMEGRERIIIYDADPGFVACAFIPEKRLLGLFNFVDCTSVDLLKNYGIIVKVPNLWGLIGGTSTTVEVNGKLFELHPVKNSAKKGFKWKLKVRKI